MGEETRAAVRAIEMVERKDRVLIVEDEDNARKGYEQLLQRWAATWWAWGRRKKHWQNSRVTSRTR